MFKKRAVANLVTNATNVVVPTLQPPTMRSDATERPNSSAPDTPAPKCDSGKPSDNIKCVPVRPKRRRSPAADVCEKEDEKPAPPSRPIDQSAAQRPPAAGQGNGLNQKSCVCKPFMMHGTCKYGDNCKYAHILGNDGATDKHRYAWSSDEGNDGDDISDARLRLAHRGAAKLHPL